MRQLDARPGFVLAIVAESDVHFGTARTVQMLVEEKRGSVRVFKDLDRALDWLAVSDEDRRVLADLVNREGWGQGLGARLRAGAASPVPSRR